MTRTTITIPEPLLRRLRIAAAERGTSMAQLIRETLEQRLDQQRPKPRLGLVALELSGEERRIAHEGPVPPRSFDHIMGRAGWSESRAPRVVAADAETKAD